MIYIYSARNTVNDKVYIGQTQNLRHRLRLHGANAYGSRQRNYRFPKAIRKYGFDAFEFKIRFCTEDTNLADSMERFYIAVLKTQNPDFGYNSAEGGLTNRGFKLSKRTILKRSKAMRKFYRTKAGLRLRQKFAAQMRGNSYAKGNHLEVSEEQCQARSERMKGNNYKAGYKTPARTRRLIGMKVHLAAIRRHLKEAA